MANPNFTPSWPLYKDADGAYVSALPIKAINTLMTEVQTQNSTVRILTSTCQRKQ